MQISPTQYLAITDKIITIQQKYDEISKENRTLKDKITIQEETIKLMKQEKNQLIQQAKQTKNKLMEHVTNSSDKLKEHFSVVSKEHKSHIEQLILELSQDSNSKKLKDLGVKIQEDRVIYAEYVNFYEKIKTLYHSCTKKKQKPTIPFLIKWVQEGRNHEIVANDIGKDIFAYMLGQSSSHQKKPSKKFISKPVIESNKNIGGTRRKLEQSQTKENKKPMDPLAALIALGKAKEQENKQRQQIEKQNSLSINNPNDLLS